MKENLMTQIGLLALRLIPSIFMISHGFPKFQDLVNGVETFPSVLGMGSTPSLFLAVLGEFICPILVIVGFKTRWMAIPTALTMLVAAFVVHSSDPFFLSYAEGGGAKELAILYFTFFALIFLLGPGKYSIDKR